MCMAHIKTIDLNLLFTLEALFRHQNVSHVAKELGITQSGISHSLSRLREHYKDPLFVRASKGVTPTEFAKSIRNEVEEFITRALSLSEKVEQFDPRTVQGRITIATTDYFEIVIGSKLYARLAKEAPGVQISLRPTFGSLPKEQLEDGTYDIAVAGFYKDLPEGFYQQRLFTDSFSTAFRKDHSKIRGKLTQTDFFESDHLLITLQGDFKDRLSKLINGKRKSRKIQFGSASFTGPAWTISESDLLLTAPTQLLMRYKEHFPIRIELCPVEVTPIAVQMVWHGVSNQNPLKKWVRQLIKEICADVF
jgi:DNA-binding transcriptional LysR family regulator